jgi:protein-S-isoprenylcysteine O-methyltransferase Ste14
MIIHKIVYWAAMIIEIVIRAPYQKAARAGAKSDRRVSQTEKVLLGLLWTVMFLIPAVYTLTPWLDFANYTLPAWMGWVGVILMVCALLIFWGAHADLKSNWSPTLEIRQDHALVTSGIFAYIRHPMYASQWVWAIAQILLLQNWLAGPTDLFFFIFFYFLRVRAEEKMMLDAFGEQYHEYMLRTGGVIPKL